MNAYNSTRNTVPETILCYYGHEMLSILATLHQCGIIHADVKPDNFMLKDLRYYANIIIHSAMMSRFLSLLHTEKQLVSFFMHTFFLHMYNIIGHI